MAGDLRYALRLLLMSPGFSVIGGGRGVYGMAGLACWPPARGAARINPVIAPRAE